MGQADRDWYRSSQPSPSSEPEAWGHARATWVLTGILACIWLLPGAVGRARLEQDFALHPLALPADAWALFWYELLAPQGGPGIALACLALLWLFARDGERDGGAGSMMLTFLAGAFVAGLAAWGVALLTREPGLLTGAHGGTCALAARWAVRRRGGLVAGLPPAVVAAAAIAFPAVARLLDVGDRIALAWTAGALPGVLLGRFAARGEAAPLGVPAAREPEAPAAEAPSSRETKRRRVDALLAKIHAKGIDSLSKAERTFLSEASREFRDGDGRE
jgi:hypothetical protein